MFGTGYLLVYASLRTVPIYVKLKRRQLAIVLFLCQGGKPSWM
jgi:hypothetical protein